MTIVNVEHKYLTNMRYYDKIEEFSDLYKRSKANKNFHKLYERIIDEKNILLAYRCIRTNRGSKTKGCDNLDISFFEKMTLDEVVTFVRKYLGNYQPRKVRRVFIPKKNGEKRPLGIPSIKDRLIQQCIRQVLEPICEAKFYDHSYGFRPHRSTHYALGRNLNLINHAKLYYIVDIDIKGFFDNVNHKKLLQQIYTMGIKDKIVLKIISKMLKAEIDGEGIPNKGVPQGGILSPLLSNIVLNELDWWIASQWDTFPSKFPYVNKVGKHEVLKKASNLKEIRITRYADDFQIYCRTKSSAEKIKIAVTKWLKERLKLEVNEDKSSIINLKNRNVDYLGFKIRLREKGNKKTHSTEISNSNEIKLYVILREQIKNLIKNPSIQSALKYNQTIVGTHNYFKYASQVAINLNKINWWLYFQLVKLEKKRGKPNTKLNNFYNRTYGKYKTFSINGVDLIPIHGINHVYAKPINQNLCLYTETGRILVGKANLDLSELINEFINRRSNYYSLEMINFGASLINAQKGRCRISSLPLEYDFEIHHVKPKEFGGTDEYKNLIAINPRFHKLIHYSVSKTINNNLDFLALEHIEKINHYRKLANRTIIEL
ncbi:group II intron reverse transcriptase/maturase [uncultured Ilyobacter sp.]|uniref:group II intron reverse transcriptase/maturase n=1 Tax=uncultured Ilyobacter sp. TaxID=544433 RepID=UPI0029F55FFF|nr:group II intron reverse transcriptase/maturase [uncultured Ilyobacter sp.]